MREGVNTWDVCTPPIFSGFFCSDFLKHLYLLHVQIIEKRFSIFFFLFAWASGIHLEAAMGTLKIKGNKYLRDATADALAPKCMVKIHTSFLQCSFRHMANQARCFSFKMSVMLNSELVGTPVSQSSCSPWAQGHSRSWGWHCLSSKVGLKFSEGVPASNTKLSHAW